MCIKPTRLPQHQDKAYSLPVLQVLLAACIKLRVKLPENPDELYEVDREGSVVRGSRKMEHSNQLQYAPTPLLQH